MPTPSASDPLTATGESPAIKFGRDLGRLGPGHDDKPIIAAVSGGADSLALLLLLHTAVGARLRVATVDHGLREESANEAALVAGICADRAIPHETLRGPLPKRAGRTANVSARARQLRYDLLDQYRLRENAGWVATAHHADDQLETMIMRLNRGAGVRGLSGIRERQGHIVRPLLDWRREALVQIVAEAGLTPVEDPTNSDERYDRARLRKLLVDADWLDRERFAYSAHNLNAANEALDWAADLVFERNVKVDGAAVVYTDRAIPKEMIRRLLQRCVWHVDPHADCSKLALTSLFLKLRRGERCTIGNVLCSVDPDPAGDFALAYWRFRPAPPRRAGT